MTLFPSFVNPAGTRLLPFFRRPVLAVFTPFRLGIRYLIVPGTFVGLVENIRRPITRLGRLMRINPR